LKTSRRSHKSGHAADATQRRLLAAGNPEALDSILQNECRRRASRKLAATLLRGGDSFRFPTALSAEQCTADDVAAIHAAMIPEGARLLDMTCGLGIDAFHCAERAAQVTAIDLNSEVAAAIEPNAAALGLKNVTGLCADSAQWLAEQAAECHFEVVFIDPARRGENGQRLYGLADCRPDVLSLLPLIRAHASRLIIKASPMLDLTRTLSELPADISGRVALYVIGTTDECKELVIDLDFTAEPSPEVDVHVTTVGHPTLTFGFDELNAPGAICSAEEIVAGSVIGEPWPAVMKAAPFARLSGRQLHRHTHVFLNPSTDFPGNLYRVTEVLPFSSSTIKQLARTGVDASVAVRNLPIKADELRRRLRARESAEHRLLGVTAGATTGTRLLLFLTPLTSN
jgi:hypothetical protein